MTTGEIISLIAVGLSLVLLLLTMRHNKHTEKREDVSDVESAAKTIAEIKADTRYTAKKVAEISDDVKTLRGELSAVSLRVAMCEESNKSAHKRLDGHEQRILEVERRIGGK